MVDFDIEKISDSTTVVYVRGELTETTREYFFSCINDLFGNKVRHVIIDCGGLGYISSGGLASLLSARKKAEKDSGKIYLTDVDAKIAKILSFTNMHQLFSIFPTTRVLLEKLDKEENADLVQPDS